MKYGTAALVGGGLFVAFIAAFSEAKAATPPNPAPRPPPTPGTEIGHGSPNQQRPVPALGNLSESAQRSYIATMQTEMANALGFGDTIHSTGDMNDPGTVVAIHTWLSVPENLAMARAYGYGAGGNTDAWALINAIDDQARGNMGVDPASDYRAPATTTHGLYSGQGLAERPRMVQDAPRPPVSLARMPPRPTKPSG